MARAGGEKGRHLRPQLVQKLKIKTETKKKREKKLNSAACCFIVAVLRYSNRTLPLNMLVRSGIGSSEPEEARV